MQPALAPLQPEFPSPFGVRVLKFFCGFFTRTLLGVSVPFRGSCSEIEKVKYEGAFVAEFPSPFGVRVLKSEKTFKGDMEEF